MVTAYLGKKTTLQPLAKMKELATKVANGGKHICKHNCETSGLNIELKKGKLHKNKRVKENSNASSKADNKKVELPVVNTDEDGQRMEESSDTNSSDDESDLDDIPDDDSLVFTQQDFVDRQSHERKKIMKATEIKMRKIHERAAASIRVTAQLYPLNNQRRPTTVGGGLSRIDKPSPVSNNIACQQTTYLYIVTSWE